MDDQGRLRRKDTTKGPPLRILSLDGGGVRGYSMLIILQELMHRTFVETEGRAPKRHEIPKPCDHFDLIAGTGTGGLIAIMLGRLRLDLDTCKDVYVRMTRRAFETDKTIAGIPYKSTMFKASKLEEVIKECVSQHTIFEDEGNDTIANATPMTPPSTGGSVNSPTDAPHRTMSQGSRYSQVGVSPIAQRMGTGFGRQFGSPNAQLYDARESRTKTAVTAVLRGTATTTLLRSYDSRREPAPDVKCTIWEAGRATSAIHLAFKPIQIGQSVYLDEGNGKYNPAPVILDEAVQSEWPGREVGVFVSIGTGKRPPGTDNQQQEWWEGFMGGTIGAFAEARRRLIRKLEACEETHQYMLREHLGSRQVNVDNYYRLNVEVGVGEFGLNEWARLSEISTNTRTYLHRHDVEVINQSCAAKLARIHLAKVRHDRSETRKILGQHERNTSWQNPWERPLPTAPHDSIAAELPGDDQYYQPQAFRPGSQQSYEHRPSIADQKYTIVTSAPGFQDHRPSVTDQKYTVLPDDADEVTPTANGEQRTPIQRPPPQYGQQLPISTPSNGPSPRHSHDSGHRPNVPPPLPPKTPLPYPDQLTSPQTPHSPQQWSGSYDGAPRTFMNMGELGRRLPYPDMEGPPPAVNTASKPTLTR
ncbi:hypothetical protein BAUCODRAFT_108956 [Baudoinia panamericana UAMH 10762]|uniref:PNPLA domain-containing protein n=1 Tax=Baudoinia panamericana (strain UAMH 10762) TaxID=717646 RepID=M2MVI2_BAUPA|nr:uncharacterized protein BAUCODRAFT_108956 [Baudoinia panamericana UAMH 10762]EMC95568.1 hypothetical protein BAUCODRAFT_108956 [Baudoinia panamericana UAMH 10762]